MRNVEKSSSSFLRNFGGLAEDLSGYKGAKFVVLGIPYETSTTYIQGTSGGPSSIIDASMNM